LQHAAQDSSADCLTACASSAGRTTTASPPAQDPPSDLREAGELEAQFDSPAFSSRRRCDSCTSFADIVSYALMERMTTRNTLTGLDAELPPGALRRRTACGARRSCRSPDGFYAVGANVRSRWEMVEGKEEPLAVDVGEMIDDDALLGVLLAGLTIVSSSAGALWWPWQACRDLQVRSVRSSCGRKCLLDVGQAERNRVRQRLLHLLQCAQQGLFKAVPRYCWRPLATTSAKSSPP